MEHFLSPVSKIETIIPVFEDIWDRVEGAEDRLWLQTTHRGSLAHHLNGQASILGCSLDFSVCVVEAVGLELR